MKISVSKTFEIFVRDSALGFERKTDGSNIFHEWQKRQGPLIFSKAEINYLEEITSFLAMKRSSLTAELFQSSVIRKMGNLIEKYQG